MSDLPALLDYLADLGYEDLYLRTPPTAETARPASTAPPAAPAAPAAAFTPPPPRRASSRAAPGPESTGPPAPAFAASDDPFERLTTGPVPADRDGRAEQLAALDALAQGCRRCPLAETRNRVVFGAGDPHADLMFIGEGPGANEDRQGLPFVGAAGELLTKIIHAIDLTRDRVYIANVVKCRPPNNRDPLPGEVAACRGYLERQIELIRPKVLVALGKVAAQTLLGTDSTLGRMRGQWWKVHGVPTRVTYHPAALLRSSGLKRPTWEDLQIVRDRLRRDPNRS